MTRKSLITAASLVYVGLALTAGCGPERRTGVPTVAEPEAAAQGTVGAQGTAVQQGGEGSPGAAEAQMTSADGSAPDEPETRSAATPAGDSDAVDTAGQSEDGSASAAPRELFVGWDAPVAVLMVTGQQHGYIEPCGCTQLANQKGGLARRHTLAKQLAARGWPLVGLDAGNQVRRFGRQAEIKFQMTLDGLKTIGYEAIVLGVDDLRLSVNELVAATVPPQGQTTPFLCANAAVLDWSLMAEHNVIERGGKKIGVTAIVGAQWRDDVARDDVVFKDPMEGLRSALPKLQAANCDLLVLLAHASVAESKKLAKEFPQFDLVVAAGAPGDPSDPLYQPEAVEGTPAMFVQTGIKGMYAGIIGIFDDEETPLRYQRVPLDASLEDSPEMLQLLKSYQNQLETLGLAGLGIRPVPHASGNKFMGSEKCGECHTKAFEVWETSLHATATESLVNPVERAEIPRYFDPECLSCHVTGWHPQRFFPFTSGYLDLEKSQLLHGNGCENCHGPGSAHVAAEEGTSAVAPTVRMQLRKSMRLPESAAEAKCIECHDIDNSPGFFVKGAFQRYWADVEHVGRD